MGETIGIGVIGIGFGQLAHVPAFRSDPRCEVRAICASTEAHARDVAMKLGIPDAYCDALQLIADPEVDAVSIALPPGLQPALVHAAAAAGKHAFCEKPIGLDVKQANEAYEAALAADVISAVNFIFPESPAWEEARRILQSGQLGRLRHAAIDWRVETRAYAGVVGADNWKNREPEGGGTLRNLVSHSAYYIEWLLGEILSLNCNLRGLDRASVDAGVEAWLELQAGPPLTLSVAADSFRGSGHRIEIYGERGSLILRNETSDYINGFELLAGTRDEGKLTQRVAPIVSTIDGRITATSKLVSRFLDSIQNRTAATPNLQHGLRVQRILEAMRESHDQKRWIEI